MRHFKVANAMHFRSAAAAACLISIVATSCVNAAQAEAPITDCDKFAALDFRSGKESLSVAFSDLNSDAAITACRKAIEEFPDARFHFQLGRALEKAGNMQLAIDQYQAATDGWYVPAIYTIGRLYALGKGLAKDLSKAVIWYTKAAEHGNPSAQFELALMYRFGNGVPKDSERAASWYAQAAQQGHSGAQLSLGQLYDSGDGVNKDPKLAVYWYTKAADQGMPEAQNALGYMCLNGSGTLEDPAFAARLFAAAAVRGIRQAQFNLAVLYENGVGVEFDMDQAVYWYSKAGEQGDENAAQKAATIKAAWLVLKPYMQASHKKYKIVSARAIEGVPGAIVCGNHDRVSLVYDLYTQYLEDTLLNAVIGGAGREQDRLLHGRQAPPSVPNVHNYGCELVDPGTKMYMEIGNLVPVVVFINKAGSLYRGVTFESMLQ
jgi:TPR repeat protein